MLFSLLYHTIQCGSMMFIGCHSSFPIDISSGVLTLTPMHPVNTSCLNGGSVSLQLSRNCTFIQRPKTAPHRLTIYYTPDERTGSRFSFLTVQHLVCGGACKKELSTSPLELDALRLLVDGDRRFCNRTNRIWYQRTAAHPINERLLTEYLTKYYYSNWIAW